MNKHAARLDAGSGCGTNIAKHNVAGGDIDLSADEMVSYGGVTEQK